MAGINSIRIPGQLYPEDCPEKDPVPARESLNFWCRRSFRQGMLVLLFDDSPIVYSNHEVNSAEENFNPEVSSLPIGQDCQEIGGALDS